MQHFEFFSCCNITPIDISNGSISRYMQQTKCCGKIAVTKLAGYWTHSGSIKLFGNIMNLFWRFMQLPTLHVSNIKNPPYMQHRDSQCLQCHDFEISPALPTLCVSNIKNPRYMQHRDSQYLQCHELAIYATLQALCCSNMKDPKNTQHHELGT